jgi:hypothetical protein
MAIHRSSPFLIAAALVVTVACTTGAPPPTAAPTGPGADRPAPAAARAEQNAPRPRPGDVASIDAIIDALYDVISGPVAEPRDWDRFRSLFIPGGRLVPTAPGSDGQARHQVLTPDDYVAGSGEALMAIGFREREIARTTEEFGAIAHVFSTYEAFRGDETEPFLRGINSIQLFDDGDRWWIVTVLWSPEHPGSPIPGRYLR